MSARRALIKNKKSLKKKLLTQVVRCCCCLLSSSFTNMGIIYQGAHVAIPEYFLLVNWPMAECEASIRNRARVSWRIDGVYGGYSIRKRMRMRTPLEIRIERKLMPLMCGHGRTFMALTTKTCIHVENAGKQELLVSFSKLIWISLQAVIFCSWIMFAFRSRAMSFIVGIVRGEYYLRLIYLYIH